MSHAGQTSQTVEPLRLGVVGLGRGFTLTARGLKAHPKIDVVAAASRNESARQAFKRDFSGRTYERLDQLCLDEQVEMIYVATPHELHCEHVVQCAEAGKHVVVEKPMAITLEDAAVMVQACDKAGVKLVVGPSHSFDAPVLKAREVIASGRLGDVQMVHSFYATDFLYRPRTDAELQPDQGGVIYSQGAHQVDVVRMLVGSKVEQVQAIAGNWDSTRQAVGAYTAQLKFESGAFATLTYSGYAHYDGDICMGDVNELGVLKKPGDYGKTRAVLDGTHDEQAAKAARRFNGLDGCPNAETHEHFGSAVVFCEQGDVRMHANGIELFENAARTFIDCEFNYSRQDFCNSLVQAVRFDNPPPQDGHWGLESLSVCNAILASHTNNSVVKLD